MVWRVLVVDDEIEMRALVCALLNRDGFESDTADGGESALHAIAARPPDLVILDVGLAGEDGIDVGRRIREASSVPIMFLTGHAGELAELAAFAVGADDFITKPFQPRVLIARVRAVIARAHPATDEVASSGIVQIDLEARTVRVNDREVHLTRTEFDILTLMYERPNSVVRREQIADAVWGAAFGTGLIDGHMSRMRSKIVAAGGPRLGIAVRGVGYRLGPGGR